MPAIFRLHVPGLSDADTTISLQLYHFPKVFVRAGSDRKLYLQRTDGSLDFSMLISQNLVFSLMKISLSRMKY